jgi:hypothetical protein
VDIWRDGEKKERWDICGMMYVCRRSIMEQDAGQASSIVVEVHEIGAKWDGN